MCNTELNELSVGWERYMTLEMSSGLQAEFNLLEKTFSTSTKRLTECYVFLLFTLKKLAEHYGPNEFYYKLVEM